MGDSEDENVGWKGDEGVKGRVWARDKTPERYVKTPIDHER